MVHHYGVYGFFSEAVQPYNEMEIFHRILTPEALPLSRIVDPYTYLGNGRFDDMPKLILPSVQVNMRGGRLPEPESNGVRYLKLPLNRV